MNYLKILSFTIFASLFFISCDDGREEKPTLNDGAYTGTVTVAPGTPAEFTLNNVNVEFSVNEKDATVGQIEMFQVKFAEAMPVKIDMTIDGVTLSKTSAGYSISGDNIIPTAMGGPFAQYTITGLEGTATEDELEFSMTCGIFPVSYTGTVIPQEEGAYTGTFTVESTEAE